ncbi:Asp23/Gls24 family envelope stress response protein [Frigoribacterium sp. CFBP 13712]|uniref:Asp23/Gls24 family envelope stress response protein n=1 Tax=Frigoribacterium sp. CFBP 13712 TaxID=2775309 RepID=UPI00178574B4|nr:Asp23/Gls24 family envelope stress response protein [Frigoribacterium sp. CFBP 13712]MBD8704846.1 Asp23/Gls24 family envelope stress response protein [Frigoribacterium sp. CFBP 13712]
MSDDPTRSSGYDGDESGPTLASSGAADATPSPTGAETTADAIAHGLDPEHATAAGDAVTAADAEAELDAAVDAAPDDGVSIERIADYLDEGRQPYDPLIEDDPSALAQLNALQRLRGISAQLLTDEVAATPAPAPSWIADVMSRVRLESRSGREIPLTSTHERTTLHITEGAVRGLIREAGDSIDGALVISCAIVGDVAQPDAIVTVDVAISALYGVAVQPLADEVRDAVARHLLQQTELVVESVDVTVRDVHQLDDEADGGL